MKKFVLISCLLLLFGKTLAQSCNCPEADKIKKESKFLITDYLNFSKSSNTFCKAKVFELIGEVYLENQSFDTCEIYFKKAEEKYFETKCGEGVLIKLYKNWAQLYYTKSEFANAQEYTLKYRSAAEKANNIFEIASSLTMIAQLFNQTNQAEKGIVFTRQATGYLEKIKDTTEKMSILFQLSKRFLWHYQDTKVEPSLDSSEMFSNKLLLIAKATNSNRFITKAFNNLQGVAYEKSNYTKALQLIDSGSLYTDPNNYSDKATNYFDKSDLLIEFKNYKEADRFADSALYYYKLLGNLVFVADVYQLKSRIARLSGDYKTGYELNEEAETITDSLRSVEKSAKVAELEKKYNQAKNEITIKELSLQRKVYFLVAIAGLLGLASFAFYLRQQRLKSKQKIMQAEERLNRARINPHFFFNALSSLQLYALEEKDGKNLAINISKFSSLMRETLESTYKDYVTIEQEIDFLKEYLELQQIRFPQKFTYEIDTDNKLDSHEILVPSMILQPFVENSIEHGFTGINYAGHLDILFSQNEKDLNITITDNGKGLSTTPKENTEHISRASQIMKDRIYLMNIKLKTKASFSIDNNKDKGVVVKINIPLIKK